MINRIIVTGRLTKDVELHRTVTETAVVSFSLAVESAYKQPDGSKRVNFFDCVAWGNTAESAAKYLSKGSLVAVDGHLEQRDFTLKDGSKRRAYEIIADSVQFLDSKAKADELKPEDVPPAIETVKAE